MLWGVCEEEILEMCFRCCGSSLVVCDECFDGNVSFRFCMVSFVFCYVIDLFIDFLQIDIETLYAISFQGSFRNVFRLSNLRRLWNGKCVMNISMKIQYYF